MRIFTGSPYHHIDGGEAFFARDSGLLSRGFRALGIESKAITLGPKEAGDLSEMIRATWQEMENPDWWHSLELDGLVFITWGNHPYRKMIQAASDAGIPVIQTTDTQGVHTPVSGFSTHLRAEAAHYWHEPKWKQIVRTITKLPITTTFRVAFRDFRDVRTITTGEFFSPPTPCAAKNYKRLVERLQGSDQAKKIRYVPFPVNFTFHYDASTTKQDEVVAVGRWDSMQKRTPFLIAAISETLAKRPTVKFRIFGQQSSFLKNWHRKLSNDFRSRVILEGLLPNSELAAAYKQAKVILVSAAYEGCHNASAEAISSGASVVGCRSPFLGAIEWHASMNSGRLATEETPQALSKALLDELQCWDNGGRDPAAISAEWVSKLRADHVARQFLELFNELKESPRSSL